MARTKTKRNMQIKGLLSPQLSGALRRSLRTANYESIAQDTGYKPATLRQIVYRQMPVTAHSVDAVTRLVKCAIHNCAEDGTTLAQQWTETN